MNDSTVHKGNASKTEGTTPFGVRVPDAVLGDFEATRRRFRPDLQTRQEAVIEAMESWIRQQRDLAA